MTDFELIEKRIKRIPRLKPFFAETVALKVSINVVRQVIKKLVRRKDVVSVSRGIYVRPKPVRYFKLHEFLISPQSEDVIRLIAKKTGETIISGYFSALNYVGLSTQIPVRPIYYTSGRSRIIKFKRGAHIRLEHINPKEIVMPGTVICLVVIALRDSQHIHPLSIKKIHNRLTPDEYAEVINNLNKMPERIREAFISYQYMDPNDSKLKDDY